MRMHSELTCAGMQHSHTQTHTHTQSLRVLTCNIPIHEHTHTQTQILAPIQKAPGYSELPHGDRGTPMKLTMLALQQKFKCTAREQHVLVLRTRAPL